ncbi:MAG TPA: hypothetical protein VFV99_14615 [Kofleriaceae bacterium]|nr:hypothetical protein [Kofleriaceae bacterium]
MRMVLVCLAVAGCGVKSNEPFLLDTADCSVVNNFKVDNQATPWTDCRAYWSGTSNVLTVELTTPASMGSFLAPAPMWIRASVQVDADVNATLRSVAHPASALPSTVASDQIAIDLVVPGCGNIGANGVMIKTMADVGDKSVGFSLGIDGTCSEQTVMHALSGGFIVSAAAQAGSTAASDPATVVSVP